MADDTVTDLTDAEAQAQEDIRNEAIQIEATDDAGEFTMRILVEDSETIDGRYFTSGSVGWRNPPLSLMFTTENLATGHKGSKVGGVISKIWRDGSEIWGSGAFASNEEGQELRALIREGALSGVSADVGGASVELEADEEGRSKQRIEKGTIMGVTVLPMQAFNEGKVVVTASGAPVKPPSAWFTNPNLDRPTALTVTDEGRVFGHLAQWGSCHIGQTRNCLTPPRSASNYSYFAHGAVLCDDNTTVTTGKISLGTGHAQLGLNAGGAVEHYDNTGTAVADIVVGEDNHGIWFSGALRPDVDEVKTRAFRASAVSGDWRTIGGGLEMVALLAVNTPGFPVPRANLVASAVDAGEEVATALVSAGALASEFSSCEDGDCEDCEDCKNKKDETEELAYDDGCGCGKPKNPQPKSAEFDAELMALDLRILDARIASFGTSKSWDGRCHNRGFAKANPDKCQSPVVRATSRIGVKAIRRATK